MCYYFCKLEFVVLLSFFTFFSWQSWNKCFLAVCMIRQKKVNWYGNKKVIANWLLKKSQTFFSFSSHRYGTKYLDMKVCSLIRKDCRKLIYCFTSSFSLLNYSFITYGNFHRKFSISFQPEWNFLSQQSILYRIFMELALFNFFVVHGFLKVQILWSSKQQQIQRACIFKKKATTLIIKFIFHDNRKIKIVFYLSFITDTKFVCYLVKVS